MLSEAIINRLRAVLVNQSGGYFRNTIREHQVTCATCLTPCAPYTWCYQCNGHRSIAGVADAVAALTYAVGTTQSGYVMRGYKPPQSSREHATVVAVLGLVGIGMHGPCAERLPGGSPITHWAIVPSLPAKSGPHALRGLVSAAMPGTETRLTAATTAARPRDVNDTHFSAQPLPEQSHVLVVDDTWTGGGHAQSAAIALHHAGASRVSTLVLARWLNPGYGDTPEFIRTRLTRDYAPDLCPWTGDTCP